MIRENDGAELMWCYCSCEAQEPTILVYEPSGNMLRQIPIAKTFKPDPAWPADLRLLYEEAAKSYGADAFTGCAMICRKLLMVTACQHGEKDGKRFVEYVEYITNGVLQYPKAKDAITRIKDIGNDANHDASLVNQSDAHRAMQIVTYMLNAIYSFPAA
jgi:hypothetical protein